MDIVQNAIHTIQERFEDQVLSVEEHAGQPYISVKRDKIQDILKCVRDDLEFDMMTDLCGMDYLNKGMPERFCVVYNVYSYKNNSRFRVKAYVPESDPVIDTACVNVDALA